MKMNFIMSMPSGKFFPNYVSRNPKFSVHHSKTAGNKNIFLTTTGPKRVLHAQFMPGSARSRPVWKVLPLVSLLLSLIKTLKLC